MLMQANTVDTPHLAALGRAIEAQFRFRPLQAADGELVALYAERWCSYGVVENITVRSATEAVAARIRAEDYPDGDPLWQQVGPVADVIVELLELPLHGLPNAPTLARPADSALWLPGVGL